VARPSHPRDALSSRSAELVAHASISATGRRSVSTTGAALRGPADDPQQYPRRGRCFDRPPAFHRQSARYAMPRGIAHLAARCLQPIRWPCSFWHAGMAGAAGLTSPAKELAAFWNARDHSVLAQHEPALHHHTDFCGGSQTHLRFVPFPPPAQQPKGRPQLACPVLGLSLFLKHSD
jgi:hypothetical protein